MKKIRLGIVGTNFVVDNFIDATKNFEEIQIDYVSTLNEKELNEFADKYSILNRSVDYKEFKDIDLVYIATPNSTHKEISLHFINRGISVICEKPFAVNPIEANEMIEAARANNVLIMENLVPMYNPAAEVIKEYIEKIKPIRDASLVYSKYSSRYDDYLQGNNPTTFRKELANGSIMDLGIYTYSHVSKYFGIPKEVKSISSFIDSGVDASTVSLLNYDDFAVTVRNSKTSNTYGYNEINGEEGSIIFKDPNLLNEVIYVDKDGNEQIIAKTDYNPMINTVGEAIKALNNKTIETNSHTHNEILQLNKLLTDCRMSAGLVYEQDINPNIKK